MKLPIVAFVALLLLVPGVFAVSRSYQATGETSIIASSNLTQQTFGGQPGRHRFTGLQGIFGVSVEQVQPEREYGPAREFGKPKFGRKTVQAPLPPTYKGLGGIAGPGPSATKPACAEFNCKPGQYVVADTAAKLYYRCYCGTAKSIKPENLKCFDTPKLAEMIGYRAGPC